MEGGGVRERWSCQTRVAADKMTGGFEEMLEERSSGQKGKGRPFLRFRGKKSRFTGETLALKNCRGGKRHVEKPRTQSVVIN